MKTLKRSMEVPPCTTLDHACKAAISLAREKKCTVNFVFNEIKLVAHPTLTADELGNEYYRQCHQRTVLNAQKFSEELMAAALRCAIHIHMHDVSIVEGVKSINVETARNRILSELQPFLKTSP
jgi:hypothetical protein